MTATVWLSPDWERGGVGRFDPAGYIRESLPSFVMIYTGTFLLAWLVLHILTFKFGKGVFADIIPHDGQITLYDVVSFWFSQSWYAAIYVIAMLCLGFHLWHGVGSVFQELAAKGSTDFASSFAKQEKAANKMLEKLLRDFEAID